MLKKLLIIALTTLSYVVGVQAKSISGTCGEDAVWRLDGSTLTISGTGATTDYSAEASHPKWYPYKDDIRSVVVEEGITSLGSFSFYEYLNIESVSLPEGLIRIGNYAFCKCISMTTINFPTTLETIGDELVAYTQNGYVFCYCHNLTSIILPENLKLISAGSFEGCTNLTDVIWNSVDCYANVYDGAARYVGIFNETPVKKVTFGNKVKRISERTFQDRGSLTEVLSEGTIEFIGVDAFKGTEWQKIMSEPGKVLYLDMVAYAFDKSNEYDEYGEGIESYSIEIKPGTKCITDYIFNGCDYLDSVTIPESVEYLGNNAFIDCTALKTVNWNVISLLDPNDHYNAGGYFSYVLQVFPKYFNFGNEVKSLPDRLMSGCKLVKDVDLPLSVRNIGERVFEECNSLSTLTIPNGVESLGNLAISYCDNLEKLTIGEGLKEFDYYYFLTGCPKLTTLEWNAIRTIEKLFDPYHLTDSCYGPIENFLVGDKVEYIPGQLFWNNETLCNVKLGKSVKEIGEVAFRGCYSLTHVELPESLTKIGAYAFCNNSLESIILPENLTELGDWAFGMGPKLTTVICCPEVAPVNSCSFIQCEDCKFYVTDVLAYTPDLWYQSYEGQAVPIISANTHELSDEMSSPTFSLNVPDFVLTSIEDFVADTTPGEHTAYLRVSCSGKAGDFSANVCYRYTYEDSTSIRSVTSTKENHVEIFNLMGVKVYEGKMEVASSTMPKGIYVVRDNSGSSKQIIL